MKIYIIAGNHHQYLTYKNQKVQEAVRTDDHALGMETTMYTYVSSVDMLRGIVDPKGIFIGTWYERKDIREIVNQLLVTSRTPNEQLHKVLNTLNALSV